MRLVGFWFNIYLSKKIGAEVLGVFGLIMSIYLFFITLATSGIHLEQKLKIWYNEKKIKRG